MRKIFWKVVVVVGLAHCVPAEPPPRPFEVTDGITMTRLAEEQPAYFSPDGKRWLVLTRQGDLDNNSNRYSLYLFDSNHQPRLLTQLSSSSNRPAIESPRWLEDNDTICFLGEQPGEEHQLYAIRCSDGKIQRLLEAPGGVANYAMTADRRRLIYAAKASPRRLFTAQSRRHGLAIEGQSLTSIMQDSSAIWADSEIFSQRPDGLQQKIALAGSPWLGYPGHLSQFALSPDGKFMTLSVMLYDLPESWKEYQDGYMQSQFKGKRAADTVTNCWQLFLIDLESGVARPLLDAPSYGASKVLWSPDSRSLILGRSYAPLQGVDAQEKKRRQAGPFCFEYELASGAVRRLDDKSLEPLRWEAASSTVWLERDGKTLAFGRQAGEWKEVNDAPAPPSSQARVVVQEDLNTPQRLWLIDGKTGAKSLLLDLNPDLTRRCLLGKVQAIEWTARDGLTSKGALYLPPDFEEGHRYPLVIQTHGWDKDKFCPEGISQSGYAAQAMANRGMIVVQCDENIPLDVICTPREGPRVMAAYEALIDTLETQGLIDRQKVGLVGWSRTCFHVKYTLAHSQYPVAAAVVSDGIDAGYFQYLAYPSSSQDFEPMNGGLPFGEGRASWLELSPSFQIDRVKTPLLIQGLSRSSVLTEWEWFAALRRLGRAVEMVVLEDGAHDLVRPWDRQVSQELTRDWMSFWLLGREDPLKGVQNDRWRTLRQGGK